MTSGPSEEGSEGRAEYRKEEDEEASRCGLGGAGGDCGEAGEREGVTGVNATPRELRSGYSSLNFSRIWVSKGLLAGSVRRARGQGQTDEVAWTSPKV